MKTDSELLNRPNEVVGIAEDESWLYRLEGV